MGRAVIIYNPDAGSGSAARIALAAQELLKEDGWDVRLSPTGERGGARQLAEEVADDVDLLAVAGGDGSLHEAVGGLGAAVSRVVLAFLPFGNANVVARELSIPLTGEDALGLLRDGEPRTIDVGQVNGQPFLAMVGIGWDASIIGHLDRLRHTSYGRVWYRWWADSLYGVAGTLASCRLGAPRLRLTVDGNELEPIYHDAVVSNMRVYAKDLSITPQADAANGVLHFQARKRWGAPFVAWSMIDAVRQTHSPAFLADYGSGLRVHVRAESPVPVQVDGEFVGKLDEIEVEVRPAAARILVPPGLGDGHSLTTDPSPPSSTGSV